MSRRLAGVYLNKPMLRDGNILAKIKMGSGALQRRIILAYEGFVHATGSVDPMSKPDKLPPAFAAFYNKGKRDSDPIEAFVADGRYVVVKTAGMMLLKTFRDLYNQYRIEHNMGKDIKWSDEPYKTPFAERGVVVMRKTTFQFEGEDYTNVDVIVNLIAVG